MQTVIEPSQPSKYRRKIGFRENKLMMAAESMLSKRPVSRFTVAFSLWFESLYSLYLILPTQCSFPRNFFDCLGFDVIYE